ncbi:MAG: hypothetical protein ABJO86_14185 [Lentilitoribacter sp.]
MTKLKWKGRWAIHLPLAAFAFTAVTSAYAQESSNIVLELNKLTSLEASCELTFLVENKTSTRVEKLALEFAFLDKNGQLSKLATLNFGALVTQRPKIAQFGLTQTNCQDLSKIFINSASECAGVVADDCIGIITKSNKTSIEF